jgi:hypothetical protein
MSDDPNLKVVLKQTVLHGSNEETVLQPVATVYIGGTQYRVLAPPDATGEALDWVHQFSVRHYDEFGGEVESHDAPSVLALRSVEDELKSEKREATRTQGKHPDGVHCDAQICLNGHVQQCEGGSFDPKAHCPQCGETCVDTCRHCNEPIPGVQMFRPAEEYTRPQYCRGCGRPYPWMEERLRTAHELLKHDDKLTLAERNELWDLLQYVMSDPKADLVPAKRKLIEIKLGQATPYVKEIILEWTAKFFAEIAKG